jgi:CRP/FNR family transcriptional regulator, cyclic AMP receptor protein
MLSTTKSGGPAQGSAYDGGIALAFFKASGTPETAPQGATIFAEYQKATGLSLHRDKMYLLLQGEVDIIAARKPVGSVRPGEIFGEMAPLSRRSRSATAIAKTACHIIGVDGEQFRDGLEKKPEFALTLMRVMIARLRETVARQRAGNELAEDASGRQSAVFDAAMLENIVREFEGTPLDRFARGRTILQEGTPGSLMYIVVEGCAAATIQGKTVERIGPGGVFGEIALVSQSPRLASVTAETDCTLLAVNRSTFLRLLKSRPDFGASVLRALAGRLRFLISRKR